MLLIGSLGFSSLVLVVSFVFPVIALIIHRKWRLAVAREEEIKRLLALASEEAARAELEASYDYGYGEVSVPQYHQCAVCFSPTTTRCSRCKAVRYCSGKCQIVHWRQGHKEECRPASITQSINEQGIYSSQKGSEQDHSDLNSDQYNRFEGRQPKKPIDLSCESSASSETTASPEVPWRKNEEVLVECHSDGEGASSTSESSGTSFSGFTASHSSSESSDDVSVCESTSSNECEKQDRPTSAEISLNKLETSSSTKVLDGSRPLSPKFASLVDSADNLTKLNKLNNFRRVCNGEGQCKSNCSSRLGNSCICDGLNAESSESSGFWGQTLESKSDASNGRGLSNPDEGSNRKFSDSGSALLFSFNLPPTPPLSAKSSEGKGNVSDDPCPSALGSNMPPDGVVASGIRNSVSLKMSSHVMNGSASGPQVSKSRGAKSAVSLSSEVPLPPVSKRDSISNDASCKNSVISLNHHKSNHATNHKSTSYPLKSRELECRSSSASDPQLSYSASLHRTPIAKSERADTVQAHSAVSSGFMSSSNGVNGLKSSIWKAVDQFKGSKLSKQSAPGVGSEPAGRYSDKGLFSYESFVKLFNWKKVELQPCGLINCGNSCYANAVLQCLAFTPPLSAYFLQGLHSKECPKKDWCFSCEFENLILKAKEGRSPLSPVGILSQLQKIGSQLGNGREEDAHEFLRYAIDTMQSVCLKKAGMSASGPPEEETTLIGLTFGGYLRSKIKCMKCQSKSERQERMMDLTVEIEGDIGSLEEALRRFTATEVLDGENKYQCSRCKSYEKAKKKLTILEAPNVLTIALKRFQSGKFGKLNKSIQFPEILNLAPYMSGSSDKLPIYRLYGVVVHLDVMNAAFSGHYVCYVKNTQNKWFKVDDSTVTTTDLERVLTKGAYMLLYARCSPRGPRLLRNRMIASDVKNKPIPPCISGKRTTSKLKSPPAHPSVAEMYQSSIPSNDPASIENFYSGFHRLQRILEEDSTSDGSSLLSNSDEASCSTDSTRDSSGTDDFSDFIFGDSGFGWNSPWRNSSDSDTGSSSSSSSSPLYSRQSPLANLDQYDHTESGLDCGRVSTQSYNPLEGTGNDSSLHFTKQCRKSDSSNISGSSSSYRNTNSERLRGIRPFKDVKAGAILRKST